MIQDSLIPCRDLSPIQAVNEIINAQRNQGQKGKSSIKTKTTWKNSKVSQSNHESFKTKEINQKKVPSSSSKGDYIFTLFH